MKRVIKNKLIVLIMVTVMTIATAGCGWMLYPERRGGPTTGKIDYAILIFDCVWLLVGVIPGVVALTVDFLSGGMYESGGAALNVKPGEAMAFRLRGHAPMEANVKVIVQNDGREIASLYDNDFSAGQEISGPITFHLPQDLENGEYEIVLEVNGKTAAHRKVAVAN